MGIGIESHRIGGEAEFGGEGREGGVGAGGGDEGRERFEGAHAANVAGDVAGSGCEIVRGGTKDCVLGRARMRGVTGMANALARGRPVPKLWVRNGGALGAAWYVPNREMRCER